jgi:hypothetical protein
MNSIFQRALVKPARWLICRSDVKLAFPGDYGHGLYGQITAQVPGRECRRYACVAFKIFVANFRDSVWVSCSDTILNRNANGAMNSWHASYVWFSICHVLRQAFSLRP